MFIEIVMHEYDNNLHVKNDKVFRTIYLNPDKVISVEVAANTSTTHWVDIVTHEKVYSLFDTDALDFLKVFKAAITMG